MDLIPVFRQTLNASRTLSNLSDSTINEVLLMVADSAVRNADLIISANRRDLEMMEESNPLYDRLLLSESRIGSIAADIRNVAALPSPLNRVLSAYERPDGLVVSRVSVPFGVVGVIYEARPNVTFDVFSLCLKSGNACILKGGSDAINSNSAIVSVIKDVLEKKGLDPGLVELLHPGRDETTIMLNARGYIDLIIPRGSKSLIALNFLEDLRTCLVWSLAE